MDLCEVLSDFLSDKKEMKHLLSVDIIALVRFLTDILIRLCMMNTSRIT